LPAKKQDSGQISEERGI